MLFNSVRQALVLLLLFVFFINCKPESHIKDFDKLFNYVCRTTSVSGIPCQLLECNGQFLIDYQNNVFEQIRKLQSLDINEQQLKIIPLRAFSDIYQRFGCDTYSSIHIERMTVTLAKPTYLVVHEDVRTKRIVISKIANMTSLRIEVKPVIGKSLLYLSW